MWIWSVVAVASAGVVSVDSAESLRTAVESASPGDEIVLADGRYRITDKLRAYSDGTETAPIVVRSANPLGAVVEMDTVEGFHVQGAWWRFEALVIEGVCSDDSSCEHALHIVGDAEHTVVSDCVLKNFNAQIKGNGDGNGNFPDDVRILGSELYNDAPRNTGNPVTPIDVVGGQRWLVQGNHIHDHAKGGGNGISYAAFFKGNGSDGVFENNLVECERAHSGQIRLGLSLGGGGTGPDSVCENSDCSVEHTGGVLRNNIIRNCPADVGIYLNEAADTVIAHNILHNTTGIDVRFGPSTATLTGNVLDGRIRERDGGAATEVDNLGSFGGFATAYTDAASGDYTVADPGQLVAIASAADYDFCWSERGATSSPGALIEGSACDTTAPRPYVAEAPEPNDTGEPVDTDTDGTTDTGSPDTDDAGDDSASTSDSGCGCQSGAVGWFGPLGLGLLALVRRR